MWQPSCGLVTGVQTAALPISARLAARLLAEAHAAMGAAVFDHMQAAVAVAHHDHRTLADMGQLVVAGLGQLGVERHITPVTAAIEKAIKFAAVDLGFGIGPEGNPA